MQIIKMEKAEKNGRNRNSKSGKYQNQIILEKDTIKKIEKKN